MAARTLSQLQTELISRVGDETIDSDQSISWLNSSWQECLEYHEQGWPFLYATGAGTLASVTTAQTFSSVFSVTDMNYMIQLVVNGVPYTRVNWTDKDISGQAQVYAISPDLTGIVLPGGDGGTATIKYIKDLPNLVLSTDTLSAPSLTTTGVTSQYVNAFEEAVIAGAAVRFFQNALKPGMADYWQSQRNFYLDNIIDSNTKLAGDDVIAWQSPIYNESGVNEF